MIIKSEKVYDILKWIQRVAIPALITFYGVIAVTLNLPYTEQIITIASAFDALLGALLGIDQVQYNKLQAAKAAELTTEEITDGNGF